MVLNRLSFGWPFSSLSIKSSLSSDSFRLDRIEQATDPGRSADLAAVIMQEGLAQVIIVLEVFM